MWLLPAFSHISAAAARVYYRFAVSGKRVPRRGPVLLVANHPNSLLDPVLVCAAARRPVRFLAKAPLFTDPKVGWLVKGVGAIPVYRRMDDPSTMAGNVDMFRAVHSELLKGSAVGIFPEGTSHSDPALAPLKTGAARIALGASSRGDGAFPIIPIGLVIREKERFRSQAAAILGPPVEWEELAQSSPEDQDAVRKLTRRIENGLRQVTVNLERWEDKPLVECTEAIWSAEQGADRDPARRVARLEITTTILAELRQAPVTRWTSLIRDVASHCRRLKRMGLRPANLSVDVRLRTTLPWTARRLPLIVVPVVLLAVVGFILFWIPYRLTAVLVRVAKPERDKLSTFKLLYGIALHGLWVAVLVGAAALLLRPMAGIAALAIVPATGLTGLWIRERWRGAWGDVRRFFLMRSRRKLMQSLREQQADLATRLESLYEAWQSGRS